MEDTKTIRFSNMTKFMFNEDQAIIFNRLNGQWIKVPKQCYDILELCNKEGLSWSALSERLADDEDREYMKPVSYTHLDVYKRQMIHFVSNKLRIRSSNRSLASSGAKFSR